MKVEVLGPQPGAHTTAFPQVAAQISAPASLVETALWLDGHELLEKGGGSPTRGTIYGAPDRSLKPGLHQAVAYGRTASAGTAVAWRFTVRGEGVPGTGAARGSAAYVPAVSGSASMNG